MDTSSPTDPRAYQEWVNQLEQKWQAGLIPDPQVVAMILTNSRGEVLLQLRDNNPNISFANAWTLPGGVVEPGETLEQAARRELSEETGLETCLTYWGGYKRKPENRNFMIEQHIFTGTADQEAAEMILGEGQALKFFKRGELSSLSIAFEFDKVLRAFFNLP